MYARLLISLLSIIANGSNYPPLVRRCDLRHTICRTYRHPFCEHFARRPNITTTPPYSSPCLGRRSPTSGTNQIQVTRLPGTSEVLFVIPLNQTTPDSPQNSRAFVRYCCGRRAPCIVTATTVVCFNTAIRDLRIWFSGGYKRQKPCGFPRYK